MPILMPNLTTLSKSVESISKSGFNIDDIVRNSIRCDIKSILSKQDSPIDVEKFNPKTRIPLKETLLSRVSFTSANKLSLLRNETYPPSKTIEDKRVRKDITIPCAACDMKCCTQAKKENLIKKTVDDSLTSLQWLSVVNVNDLFEGKPIHYSHSSETAFESGEDSDDKRSIERDIRRSPSGLVDYQKERDIKPPHSYAALIIMAMKSKLSGKMTLSEIYKWISDNFVFYRNAEPTWQNSIRHNLSLNKCFTKIPRAKGDPGKGGYWSLVPEFANKLLENSIRKRRCSAYDYGPDIVISKRQRSDFPETRPPCEIDAKIKHESNKGEEEELSKVLLQEPATLDDEPQSPIEILAGLEHCRMDHPYGKSPVVDYNISGEENIRAIATDLLKTTSNVGVYLNVDENMNSSPGDSIFSTSTNAIRTDCIWSSDDNETLAETMTQVAGELLEATNMDASDSSLLKTLSSSLNSSNPIAASMFPGDVVGFSADLNDMDDAHDNFTDEDLKYLTARGTSVTLFPPTAEMIQANCDNIKEEPLSPHSSDLYEAAPS